MEAAQVSEQPYFTNVRQVRDYVEGYGSYWFSAGTMRFFGTRIRSKKVHGGRFFVAFESSRLGFTDRAYMVYEVKGPHIEPHYGSRDGFATHAEAVQYIAGLLG